MRRAGCLHIRHGSDARLSAGICVSSKLLNTHESRDPSLVRTPSHFCASTALIANTGNVKSDSRTPLYAAHNTQRHTLFRHRGTSKIVKSSTGAHPLSISMIRQKATCMSGMRRCQSHEYQHPCRVPHHDLTLPDCLNCSTGRPGCSACDTALPQGPLLCGQHVVHIVQHLHSAHTHQQLGDGATAVPAE